MIDSRILASLQSRSSNPGYSILITGYDTETDCNQEKLIIHLHQINKSLESIENIDGINILSKDFVIKSNLEYDDENNALKTTLSGSSNYNGSIKPTDVDAKDLMSNHVEMLDIRLKDEISVSFSEPYKKMPHIIITIDSKYKTYYNSYDLSFDIDIADEYKNIYPDISQIDSNDIAMEQYLIYKGVTITFNKLKRKRYYPMINIIAIGDAYDQ